MHRYLRVKGSPSTGHKSRTISEVDVTKLLVWVGLHNSGHYNSHNLAC